MQSTGIASIFAAFKGEDSGSSQNCSPEAQLFIEELRVLTKKDSLKSRLAAVRSLKEISRTNFDNNSWYDDIIVDFAFTCSLLTEKPDTIDPESFVLFFDVIRTILKSRRASKYLARVQEILILVVLLTKYQDSLVSGTAMDLVSQLSKGDVAGRIYSRIHTPLIAKMSQIYHFPDVVSLYAKIVSQIVSLASNNLFSEEQISLIRAEILAMVVCQEYSPFKLARKSDVDWKVIDTVIGMINDSIKFTATSPEARDILAHNLDHSVLLISESDPVPLVVNKLKLIKTAIEILNIKFLYAKKIARQLCRLIYERFTGRDLIFDIINLDSDLTSQSSIEFRSYTPVHLSRESLSLKSEPLRLAIGRAALCSLINLGQPIHVDGKNRLHTTAQPSNRVPMRGIGKFDLSQAEENIEILKFIYKLNSVNLWTVKLILGFECPDLSGLPEKIDSSNLVSEFLKDLFISTPEFIREISNFESAIIIYMNTAKKPHSSWVPGYAQAYFLLTGKTIAPSLRKCVESANLETTDMKVLADLILILASLPEFDSVTAHPVISKLVNESVQEDPEAISIAEKLITATQACPKDIDILLWKVLNNAVTDVIEDLLSMKFESHSLPSCHLVYRFRKAIRAGIPIMNLEKRLSTESIWFPLIVSSLPEKTILENHELSEIYKVYLDMDESLELTQRPIVPLLQESLKPDHQPMNLITHMTRILGLDQIISLLTSEEFLLRAYGNYKDESIISVFRSLEFLDVRRIDFTAGASELLVLEIAKYQATTDEPAQKLVESLIESMDPVHIQAVFPENLTDTQQVMRNFFINKSEKILSSVVIRAPLTPESRDIRSLLILRQFLSPNSEDLPPLPMAKYFLNWCLATTEDLVEIRALKLVVALEIVYAYIMWDNVSESGTSWCSLIVDRIQLIGSEALIGLSFGATFFDKVIPWFICEMESTILTTEGVVPLMEGISGMLTPVIAILQVLPPTAEYDMAASDLIDALTSVTKEFRVVAVENSDEPNGLKHLTNTRSLALQVTKLWRKSEECICLRRDIVRFLDEYPWLDYPLLDSLQIGNYEEKMETLCSKIFVKDLLDESLLETNDEVSALAMSLIFGRYIALELATGVSKLNLAIFAVVMKSCTIDFTASSGRCVTQENSGDRVQAFLDRPEALLQRILASEKVHLVRLPFELPNIAGENQDFGLNSKAVNNVALSAIQLACGLLNKTLDIDVDAIMRYAVTNFPNLLREEWESSCSQRIISWVDRHESFLRCYLTSQAHALRTLLSREISAIQYDGMTMTVKVNDGESVRSIVFKFKNYPLKVPQIKIDAEDRSMILAVHNIVKGKDKKSGTGSCNLPLAITYATDAIRHQYSEISECPICYFKVHRQSQSLPTKICNSCESGFHPECLYRYVRSRHFRQIILRWYQTSNTTKCPMCRNVL